MGSTTVRRRRSRTRTTSRRPSVQASTRQGTGSKSPADSFPFVTDSLTFVFLHNLSPQTSIFSFSFQRTSAPTPFRFTRSPQLPSPCAALLPLSKSDRNTTTTQFYQTNRDSWCLLWVYVQDFYQRAVASRDRWLHVSWVGVAFRATGTGRNPPRLETETGLVWSLRNPTWSEQVSALA